ncbi:angiopoietin-1 receptor-like [Stylophora pistillata]|uniref:angiopoietin-1 receptor-like n=1 Tax=Stylophora pistillata TaxID=50429 RepID=UPI000C03ED8B|nr:angiopoietin-1 receptor-like [Stylophora pistillata]
MEKIRDAPTLKVYMDILNCSNPIYDSANGGDAPECYQWYDLPGDDTESTDCYYGVGVGYRGNVNITQSGRPCQSWKSQCPHRHWRIPKDVAISKYDSNMCRNPDSSAPDGPWCYTTDPNVRWEYCNVSRCALRVPEEAPTLLKGRPFNSTAILISWKNIPPSRHKEKLLGYRIQYRSLWSEIYEKINTTSNLAQDVITQLCRNTAYVIMVNGFNEIGHGPTSSVLVLKTLSSGEYIFEVDFQLIIDSNFTSDLLNSSSKRFLETTEVTRSSIKHHFNESSMLKIYDVVTIQFRNGSVRADIKVLVTINTNTTDKDDALNYLIGGMRSSFGDRLKVTSILVQETPRPPKNFFVRNAQSTYFILTWEEPEYNGLYQVRDYIIERKISRLKKFTAVWTVPYPETRMIIKNLDPSTEYTIRISSNNKYGRSEGVLLTQNTLPDRFIRDLMLVIALPLFLASVFILAVCLKFRPICKSKQKKEEIEFSIEFGNWVEIPGSDVTLQDKLGEGAFGEVYKGLVRLGGQERACAVKKLKANATETERRDLINELAIMVTVGVHPNVLSLIGACTKTESVLVIVRLAPNGSLLDQLKRNRVNPYYNVTDKQINFTPQDKVKIARDVACGMLHLSNKKCVYRDLAARNVLLGENNVAMVSDFGLSRDVYESGEYENTSGGMLPVRWMALESLEDYTYNTKTDVWSFGVLLWEIQSGGKMPYSGLSGMEIIEFLKTGQILTKPDGCPTEIYDIMRSCWSLDPTKRSSFSELLQSLEEELKTKDDLMEDKSDHDFEKS